jgi:hypothetical protein
MLALPPRNSNNFSRFQSVIPEAVKKFVIAAICLTATLASSAPAKDKNTSRAAQDTLVYQGPQCGSPLGTASSFYIGPFPIIVPPLIVQPDALASKPRESSLMSTHGPNPARYPLKGVRNLGCKSGCAMGASLGYYFRL